MWKLFKQRSSLHYKDALSLPLRRYVEQSIRVYSNGSILDILWSQYSTTLTGRLRGEYSLFTQSRNRWAEDLLIAKDRRQSLISNCAASNLPIKCQNVRLVKPKPPDPSHGRYIGVPQINEGSATFATSLPFENIQRVCSVCPGKTAQASNILGEDLLSNGSPLGTQRWSKRVKQQAKYLVQSCLAINVNLDELGSLHRSLSYVWAILCDL